MIAPVGAEVAEEAGPAAESIDVNNPLSDLTALSEAVTAGVRPLKAFLTRNAGERERSLFLELARDARPDDQRDTVAGDDLLVLLPLFLVTELSEAFQIGFLVFPPFLIVDLVVAKVLMSLGMHMLEPTRIAMPFKLLLFVLVDGWYLLARALVLDAKVGESAAAVDGAATAAFFLNDRARIQPGPRLLVVGASGSIGTFAVQFGNTWALTSRVCAVRET